MTNFRTAALSLLVLLLAFASACTDQPRSGSTISNRFPTYSGYHYRPNVLLEVQIFNARTSKWDGRAVMTSAGTPTYTDPCGVSWYPWQVTVSLPRYVTTGPYWQPTGSWLMTRVAESLGDAPLASFGLSSNTCISKFECGTDAIANCGDPTGLIVISCSGSGANCR